MGWSRGQDIGYLQTPVYKDSWHRAERALQRGRRLCFRCTRLKRIPCPGTPWFPGPRDPGPWVAASQVDRKHRLCCRGSESPAAAPALPGASCPI